MVQRINLKSCETFLKHDFMNGSTLGLSVRYTRCHSPEDFSLIVTTQKMEAACSSGTFVFTDKTTRCHNKECLNIMHDT
jgi:hypothetical protein